MRGLVEKISMALSGAGGPSHPMADIRQARKLISELSAFGDVKALEEVTLWLDSVNRSREFKLEQRFEVVDLLDQLGRSRQRKLGQQFFGADMQDRLREKKLRQLIVTFWRTLANAYIRCVDQACNTAPGPRGLLPLSAGRALRALTMHLKWAYQQYGPIESRIWSDVGRLYALAESQGFATVVSNLYAGAQGEGTVQQEFLKAMMLAVSSTDRLTPEEQETAERTIAHLCQSFTLHSNHDLGSNHCFDLSLARPPARTQAGMETTRTTRYIDSRTALPALEQLIQRIDATKTVPSDISLGRTFEVDAALSVMRHLGRYWSDKPPARRSERRKLAAGVKVAHSYKQVLKNISPAASDTAAAADIGSESWVVEDLNEGGFGAMIPPGQGSWIEVGSLLGLQTEAAPSWTIGVVRRVTRDQHQQCHVGIQLLSKAVAPVTLSPTGAVLPMNTIRRGDPAVLLSARDQNGEIDLLLRADSFTPGQALEMTLRDKRYHLLPSKLVEGGHDFDCAKFKVVQRQ